MIRSPLDLFTSIFSQEMIERIGWVLIHSIWQFKLLAIFALVMLQLMHRYSASIRYLLLSAIMFATVIVPVATWLAMGSSRLTNNRQSIAKTDHENLFPKISNEASSASSSELQTKVAVEAIAIADSRSQVSSDIPKSFTSQSPFQSRSVDPWRSRIASFVQPWLPVSVSVWCLGVLVFSLRPILSWWTIRRLQTVGVTCVTDSVQKQLAKLKQTLIVGRGVKVLQSALIRTPIVVGVFRSVILLPIGLVANLPPAQLEAIIAHELAHVKRYDYLVNLLQTMVETLFFYHPAVWWLSRRIRIERENCCDDLVVGALGNRVDYGKALLAVEENLGFESTLALGARDGSLLARVQRLAGLSLLDHRSKVSGTAAVFSATILTLGVATVVISSFAAKGDDNIIDFGTASNGLQFRLIAQSPDVKDDAPELKNKVKSFRRSADMTFAVELKNVSREPITLAGLRYGEGYAEESKGKLNTSMLAPFWFEFEFTDMQGKPIPRTHRELYDAWSLADNASTHLLAPGESLIEVLRPAKFIAPLDYDFLPGNYQLRARYRGPSDSFREKVGKHWPDKTILKAWPHEVTSNVADFSIEEVSNRTKPEDLIWGKPVEGLQAALEYRMPDDFTGNPLVAPGVPVGSPIGVVFHLRNASEKPITFISETSRQGDYVHVTNERGIKVEVKDVWFTGWPIDVSWKLQPGESAQLSLLTPGLGSLDQPGRYKVRYTVRFNSRMQKDDAGNVTFPRPGDFDKEVDTGAAPLFLFEAKKEISANGEIHGRLVDDETGEPIRDALVACGAVINDSKKGGGVNSKTDSLGNYRLQVPSPGIYNVWVKEYRRSNGTAAADDGILVEAGKISTSELRWSNGRWIEGKVVDQQGNPVSQIVVSAYSAARPFSGGVESVRTKNDGTFSIVVPPGRAYVYSQQQVARTDDNPLGLGPRAEATLDLMISEKLDPLTLTLGTSQSKFGSDDWLKKTTPGTQILTHENKADVRGIVVDQKGKPLADVKVFKEDGAIVMTNEKGEFQYTTDKGTQFVMHAFLPGYHLWFGTPTSGDELKVVLEKKVLPAGKNELPPVTSDKESPFRLPDHWIVVDVRFVNNDKEIVTLSVQGGVNVRRWDVASRKLISEIKLAADKHGREYRQDTLQLSADGTRVLGATSEYVGIWDTTTGDLLKKLPIPKKEWAYDCVRCLDCSADLSVIVGGLGTNFSRTTIIYDGYGIVWDGSTGEVKRMMTHKKGFYFRDIKVAPDGKRFATCNEHGGGVCVWDTSTGKLIHDFSDEFQRWKSPNPELVENNMINSVAFSPDGKQLAVSGTLGVKFFHTESGLLRLTIDAPYGYYNATGIYFSADGLRLARIGAGVKGRGYTVPIWSTETGSLVTELATAANAANFTSDGKTLTVVNSDFYEALSLWPLKNDGSMLEIANPPVKHSTVNRVEENTHFRGKKAQEFVDRWKPIWGETQLGMQYGVAFTIPSNQFPKGERVLMVAFLRNAGDKTQQFELKPDMFGNLPIVTDSAGDLADLVARPLLGTTEGNYRDTLEPGEFFGPLYFSLGLGDNPRPGLQCWEPYWPKPTIGKHNLVHKVAFKVAAPVASSDSSSGDWTAGELTSGTLQVEVVTGQAKSW